MNGKKILIIDNDKSLCDSIWRLFTRMGAVVRMKHDGLQGLREFYRLRPDLVLVDLMLPGIKGLEILREVQQATRVPVIVLTANGSYEQIANCLDAGADDYMTKPFSMNVLLARVNAVLRRADLQFRRKKTAIYDDGNLLVDPIAFQAILDGSQVKLTPIEFELLTFLILNAGSDCTFTQILSNVWGHRYISHSEYVHAFIWQLRRKLEKDPTRPHYLKSVHGVGYRFEAQIDDSDQALSDPGLSRRDDLA